jgi:hypothetical protein
MSREMNRREISPDGRDDRKGVRDDKKGSTVSQSTNSSLNPKTRLDVVAAKRKQQTALILFSCKFV